MLFSKNTGLKSEFIIITALLSTTPWALFSLKTSHVSEIYHTSSRPLIKIVDCIDLKNGSVEVPGGLLEAAISRFNLLFELSSICSVLRVTF
jgi:hypothetical protein